MYSFWTFCFALLLINVFNEQQLTRYRSHNGQQLCHDGLNIALNNKRSALKCNFDQHILRPKGEYFVIFEASFYCDWLADSIIYSLEQSKNYTYLYSSSKTQSIETLTINITIKLEQEPEYQQIVINNAHDGSSLIRFLDIFGPQIESCHPLCKSCFGKEKNNCLSCYNGNPINGMCSNCPNDKPFFNENYGCLRSCSVFSYKFIDGFCQFYPNQLLYSEYIQKQSQNNINIEQFYTSIDFHLNNTYGIFKYNQGTQNHISFSNLNSSRYLQAILKVNITLFNQIPNNCGIHFKINNSYIGSIYQNLSGLQEHNVKINNLTEISQTYLEYHQIFILEIFIRMDNSEYPFLFTVIGNYTESDAGWGIISTEIYQIQKLNFCDYQIHFECQACQSGYYIYSDGSCNQCSQPYQRIQDNYCKDFDDETQYSKYITKEYIKDSFNINYFKQYQLISYFGNNFQKGKDIYYSQIQGQYIFGGPQVWSQAKFKSAYYQLQPHHSVTIGFDIIFGPNFPLDGQFIYTIEQNQPVSKIITQANLNCLGLKCFRVYENVSHNYDSLTNYYECFGLNNDPINAYCGFYNLYIAIHQCQPYCLQCIDQHTCTQWAFDYNPTKIQFDYDCTQNQYYDKTQLLCLQCSSMCRTCKATQSNSNYVQCLTCYSTATINQFFECQCLTNQYIYNNQCLDCHYSCDQCVSFNQCIDHISSNYRDLQADECGDELVTGAEQCDDGYNQDNNDGCYYCQFVCSQDCVECDYTTGQCLTCFSGFQPESYYCKNICGDGNLAYDNTGIHNEDCDIGDKNPYVGCINCRFSFISQVCASITYYMLSFSQISYEIQICNACETGYFQNSEALCYPLCNDFLRVNLEACEDSLSLPYKCRNCQPFCQNTCEICKSELQQYYFVDQQEGCSQCKYGYQLIDDLCYSICGDQYLTQDEECDDGNLIFDDGCHFCQFQCQSSCLHCYKGQCLECQQNYELISDICQSDNQQQSSILNNTDNFSTDFQRYSCPYCLDCNQGKCIYCQSSYCDQFSYLQLDNNCRNKIIECNEHNNVNNNQPDRYNQLQYGECLLCNDGYIIDKGKFCKAIFGSGCLECQQNYLSSDQQCLQIQSLINLDLGLNMQILDINSLQYQIINSNKGQYIYCEQSYFLYSMDTNRYNYLELTSQCGNEIIEPHEFCDDGNNYQFDGCYECQFSCDINCQVCEFGKCLICNDDYVTDIEKNCKPIVCQDCKEDCFLIDQMCLQIYENSNQNRQTLDTSQSVIQISSSSQVQYIYCKQSYFSYQIDNNKLKYLQLNGECGNTIIEWNELCDDGNTIEFDGCYKCQYSCDQNCNVCKFGKCLICNDGYETDQENNCKPIFFGKFLQSKEDSFQIDQICIQIKEDFNQKIEILDTSLSENYILSTNLGQFIYCEKSYYSLQIDNNELKYLKLQGRCGNQIIEWNELCDDSNNNEFDGCYQCQYSCDQNCKICQFGKCLVCVYGYATDEDNNCKSIFGLESQEYYITMDQICSQIQDLSKSIQILETSLQKNQILSSNQGQYIYCEQSYFLYSMDTNRYNYLELTSQCGNEIIEPHEICDDGNNYQFDGCYECQFSCDINCKLCEFGKCLICNDGYTIKNNHCEPLCGDKTVTLYYEQCDDGNDEIQDGCVDCMIECQPNCVNCNELQCLKCEKGFYFNGYDCEANCGDLYVIPEIEECDDGNQKYEVGKCFECKLICDQNCIECQKGQCVGGCIEGFNLVNNICTSICNDGIVAGQEECDDGNSIEFDGCYECRFSCPLFCKACQDGFCIKCQEDYYYLEESNTCFPKDGSLILNALELCGDGFLNYGEICDDGNKYPLDGCFNCDLEENWIFISPQNYIYSKPPQQILTYLNYTHPKQYVSFEFDQEITINKGGDLALITSIILDRNNEDQYSLITHLEQPNKVIVEIEINYQIREIPQLIFQLNEDVFNKFNQTVKNKTSIVQLKIPAYVSKSALQQAQQLQSTNELMMLSLLSLGGLSILVGDTDIFFESLSVLQYQSYLKYINLDYPLNLQIYFESSEAISVQPTIKNLELDQLLQTLTLKDDPIECKGKFGFYNEDADLLSNIEVQLVQFVAFILLILNQRVIEYLVKKIISLHIYLKFLLWICKYQRQLAVAIHKRMSELPQMIKTGMLQLSLNSIKTILLINAWDLLFKSFLFLGSGNLFSSLRNIFGTILASFIVTLYLASIFSTYFIPKLKNQITIDIYQSSELFRIFGFQLFLVFCQNEPIIQLICIFMVNLIQVVQLIQMKQLFNNLEFITKLSIESSVAVVNLTSFIYLNIFSNFSVNDIKILVAEGQIYLMMFGVIIANLRILIDKIKNLWKYFLTSKVWQNINQVLWPQNIRSDPNVLFGI